MTENSGKVMVKCVECGKEDFISKTTFDHFIIRRKHEYICNDCKEVGKSNYRNTLWK